MAVGMVWVSFPSTALFFARSLWIKSVLVVLAIGITLYLFSLPTARTVSSGEENDS